MMAFAVIISFALIVAIISYMWDEKFLHFDMTCTAKSERVACRKANISKNFEMHMFQRKRRRLKNCRGAVF